VGPITKRLSDLYFDVLKDRLYTAAPRSQPRRSAQTALHRLMFALTRILVLVNSRAVKAREAIERSQPEITIARLRHGNDGALRQATGCRINDVSRGGRAHRRKGETAQP